MRDTTTAEPCDAKRRSFLKLCGLLSAGAVAGSAAGLLPANRAEALLFGKQEYKVSDNRLSMGSFLSITVFHPSRDQAQNALGLAWAEIDRLCKIFSRHDRGTAVAELNRTGVLRQAPPELLEVVNRSLFHHRLTNGAFDITVEPVCQLFQKIPAVGHPPSEDEILALLPRVGSEHLRVEGSTISFAKEGMGITLDGIAPGYICDRASTLLTKLGVTNHLLNASGDIRVSGAADKGAPWTVAIKNPDHSDHYPDIVSLRSGAIGTSGCYEIFYDQEMIYHHIITPQTGHSPLFSTSTSATAARLVDADALSTGLMVMRPEDGLRLVNTLPESQCLLISRNQGRLSRSAGWSALSSLA
ncbi:MAG: FAD:protein FMN transferase [Desulfobacteraceae bacterium]|nr:FAD:protein FMN transferase [Desulfobacteraceae bacterium]